MLHAVLDKTTDHQMEMQHLLVNPKYKELWGNSSTEELRRLAQGIPGAGMVQANVGQKVTPLQKP
jgi:hypothetical protein